MRSTILQEEIEEKVFLNNKYQLVEESKADMIRIRLKDGRTLYGVVNRDRPDARVILKMEKDFQPNAN
jgi:hypothetical protein